MRNCSVPRHRQRCRSIFLGLYRGDMCCLLLRPQVHSIVAVDSYGTYSYPGYNYSYCCCGAVARLLCGCFDVYTSVNTLSLMNQLHYEAHFVTIWNKQQGGYTAEVPAVGTPAERVCQLGSRDDLHSQVDDPLYKHAPYVGSKDMHVTCHARYMTVTDC